MLQTIVIKSKGCYQIF